MAALGGVASERTIQGSAEARKRAATNLIESHDAVLRRTARRYSICAEDAEDAYQRALEILLTKAPPIEGDSLVRWMQTVTKREALAARRQRERLLSAPRPAGGEDDRDPLDTIASDRPEPMDTAASRERVARSREALRALKPQEVRALTLKAEGYSYAEIGEITGWTYTKINRCMAEGRRRFLDAFSDIEQGRRCRELAGPLSAVADGETGVPGAADVEIHLRSCGSCRAKLRAFRVIPDRVLALTPSGPAIDQTLGGRPHEWVAERLAAVADKVREAGYSLISRGAGEGIAPAAASGGTRGAGMAAIGKILAVCGATAAGSASCVATGMVDPGAVGLGASGEKQVSERPASERPDEPAADTALQQPVADRGGQEPSGEDRSTLTPAQAGRRQFGFEQPAAAASSGGGGEFGGPSDAGGGGGGGGSSGGFGFEK